MKREFEDKVFSWLLEAGALQISEPQNPFWYTSGAIGPYFVNTHYLLNGMKVANDLLKKIDLNKERYVDCAILVSKYVHDQYVNNNAIYSSFIDGLTSYIEEYFSLNEIQYISGGERRDWFFSIILAHKLKLPHLYIYKSGKIVLGKHESFLLLDENKLPEDLKGKKVLHIVDLTTQASSYLKYWIPFLKKYELEMKSTLTIVDRGEGGLENLAARNIKAKAVVSISTDTFDRAYDLNQISYDQTQMVLNYIKDPSGTMKDFLLNNPSFIEKSVNNKDEKISTRALRCLKENIYDLDRAYISQF